MIFQSFQIMLEKGRNFQKMWLRTLKGKYKWVLLPSGTLHWLRLGPSCQQNLNQASKTSFNKEVELQQNIEMNRNTNFPKESNHVGASTIEELMWRISFSFPLNSEPTWTATVDFRVFHKKTHFFGYSYCTKLFFGPGANMN